MVRGVLGSQLTFGSIRGVQKMDDFLATYLIVGVISLIGFLLFWGAVIYFVVKFLKSDSGMTKAEKYNFLARLMKAYSSRSGSSEPGPVESEIRGMASREGINLDR